MGAVRAACARSVNAARAAGVDRLEIEFPPLLGSKTQFADYSNIEELDANRDFAMELAVALGIDPPAALWLCFGDAGEEVRARDAWPGAQYGRATLTHLAAACEAAGRQPLRPMGSVAAAFATRAASALGLAAPGESGIEPAGGDPPSVLLVVQPGNGGPFEDWLNMEVLRTEGVPMVALNGALDKLRTGYYPSLLYPELAKCTQRFIVPFEPVYYLRPLSAGLGWLYRVWPEPWQLLRDVRGGPPELVATYDDRPSFPDAIAALKRAS